MPKKKDNKSGDKQGKDKKTPKKDSSATDADKTGSGDKEKDLYLTQIRYLNEQSERWGSAITLTHFILIGMMWLHVYSIDCQWYIRASNRFYKVFFFCKSLQCNFYVISVALS